jgi:hypothetical protein
MKIEKFQLRGNNSVCAGVFQLLRGRAPAQLRSLSLEVLRSLNENLQAYMKDWPIYFLPSFENKG